MPLRGKHKLRKRENRAGLQFPGADEAVEDVVRKLTAQQKGELKACFQSFDEDHSGYLYAHIYPQRCLFTQPSMAASPCERE